MKLSSIIGVDIGGTNIKAGRVSGGSVLQKSLISVKREDPEQAVIEKLFKAIDEVFSSDVEAIGIGVPGIVAPITGIVYDVQNIPSWVKISLKRLVKEHYNVPVFINNDANCFALGEKHFGNAKQFSNSVAISMGTGLGMGVLIEDKLYNGVMCGAGEIGMLPYLNGIVEDYTGSFFFETHFGQSAKVLFEKAVKSDLQALEAYKAYGSHLGEAFKMILYMYAPEAIILGGSISKSFSFFEKSLKDSLSSFAYQKQIEHLKIIKSEMLDAPILGAAALCL
jgi:glucokinase